MAAGLGHHLLVDTQPSGGVDDDDVEVLGPGFGESGRRDGDRITRPAGSSLSGDASGCGAKTATPARSPVMRSWSTAPGRCRSQATSSGVWPWLRSHSASLPASVVLPEPCRPASITTVGGSLRERQLAGLAAQDGDQFVVDDLDDLLGRVEGSETSAPLARSLMRPTNARTTGQRDVGFQQSEPDFAGGGVDVGVGQPALAAESLQGSGEPIG